MSEETERVQEQVFDRSGTYIGRVAKASWDPHGTVIEAYEIDLDEDAAEEIFGTPVGSLEIDPMELEVREVLRLRQTIDELRRQEADGTDEADDPRERKPTTA